MGKHIQFQQQRVHVAAGISTNQVIVPAAIASTLPAPADAALVHVVVQQGFVLHASANGDADLNFSIGAPLTGGSVPIIFNRNLDNEWVKIMWLG